MSYLPIASTAHPAAFPSTSWGQIADALRTGSPQARAALSELCARYWFPIYAHLRCAGHGTNDAQDLTQAFFLYALEQRLIARADPGRGRFRSFLLGSLRWFLANERERADALKRGGGQRRIEMDLVEAEAWIALTEEHEVAEELRFDLHWALGQVRNALDLLRCEHAARGDAARFARLAPALTRADLDYAALAPALGSTEGAVKTAVHRLRRQFRDHLRRSIAATVDAPHEVEDELRHLEAVLRAARWHQA